MLLKSMKLSDKMLDTRKPSCHLRSECRRDGNANFRDKLFERPWNELVIKLDDDGKHRAYTECCEMLFAV